MKKDELKKMSGIELAKKIHEAIKYEQITKEQAKQIIKIWYAIKEDK